MLDAKKGFLHQNSEETVIFTGTNNRYTRLWRRTGIAGTVCSMKNLGVHVRYRNMSSIIMSFVATSLCRCHF